MSTLRVTTITTPSGGQPTIEGLARAWVNFDGTGTVAIRASLNVSSITDNGTGDYTVNFTTAMPDTDYCAVFGAQYNTSTVRAVVCETTATVRTELSLQIRTGDSTIGIGTDFPCVQVAIFR